MFAALALTISHNFMLLQEILKYPPTRQLTSTETNLLWKFRFYLSRDKKALTKFLKSVDWSDVAERKQATDILLPQWVDVDVDDALELLGPYFTDKSVREYAVRQLKRADDDDLLLYLLQLVQAIKYEDLKERGAYESSLVEFLTQRSLQNPLLGSYFHWYLSVECEDKIYSRIYAKVSFHFHARMLECPSSPPDFSNRHDALRRQTELVQRLCQCSKVIRSMKETRPKKIEWLKNFMADPRNGFLHFLPLSLPMDASVVIKGIVPEKCLVFKSQLLPLRLTFQCDTTSTTATTSTTPSTLSLAQHLPTSVIYPPPLSTLQDATSVSSMKAQFYTVIFKCGDDLRQDQLVMQVITLMDNLLRKENLDLKLTPYKILSTGVDHGMIQFIESYTLAHILAQHNNNLQAFLRQTHPNPNAPAYYGMEPFVMENYIKSCAGYCVITYLLGIGDRHLDNLMLTPQGSPRCSGRLHHMHFTSTLGNLFHIDFGFILGRDSKPFSPPMKLCKEMVDAMGGTSSIHYNRFKSLCYTAFIILRKSANLILNLFALMVDANIPDIRLEPDKAVAKVCLRICISNRPARSRKNFAWI